MIRFRFVQDNQNDLSVKRMCELVELPRSSFYAWASHTPSARECRTPPDTTMRDPASPTGSGPSIPRCGPRTRRTARGCLAPLRHRGVVRARPGSAADVCVAIDVFMLSEGGHVFGVTNSGTQPRWELPLPEGHAAQILARAAQLPAASLTIDAPPEAIADIREGLVTRTIDQMLVLGSDVGGAVTILDVDIRPVR